MAGKGRLPGGLLGHRTERAQHDRPTLRAHLLDSRVSGSITKQHARLLRHTDRDDFETYEEGSGHRGRAAPGGARAVRRRDRHAVGRAPLGLRSVPNLNGRGLVLRPAPEKAPVLRDVVDRLLRNNRLGHLYTRVFQIHRRPRATAGEPHVAHELASLSVDLPDLSAIHLSDVAVSALIAGGFAIVGQSAVKVWEIRQARRDAVAKVYAERVNSVMTLHGRTRSAREAMSELRSLDSRIAMLSSPLMARVQEGVNPGGLNRAREDRVVARVQVDTSRTALGEATDAFNTADSLLSLYARSPLRRANTKLELAAKSLGNDDSAKAEEINAATTSFIRMARFELNSVGSIGPMWLIYSLVAAFTTLILNPATKIKTTWNSFCESCSKPGPVGDAGLNQDSGPSASSGGAEPEEEPDEVPEPSSVEPNVATPEENEAVADRDAQPTQA